MLYGNLYLITYLTTTSATSMPANNCCYPGQKSSLLGKELNTVVKFPQFNLVQAPRAVLLKMILLYYSFSI